LTKFRPMKPHRIKTVQLIMKCDQNSALLLHWFITL
jgi:hypothetical protein